MTDVMSEDTGSELEVFGATIENAHRASSVKFALLDRQQSGVG